MEHALTDYRVVWVHGVSDYHEGYSKDWTAAFNKYLNFPIDDFIEVFWRAVFIEKMNALKQNPAAFALATQKQAEIRNELVTAVATAHKPDLVGEWSDLQGTAEGLLPGWVLDPNAYIGEFLQYLVNDDIRTAVKEKVKEKLRPLAGFDGNISIIAHSWGTVVTYESLIDLQKELPNFKLTNLFTLGSPLWLVRYLLEDSSGHKPGDVANWVNIHAQGDLISNWLRPDFQVDQDYGVPDFGGSDAHNSYLLDGNVAVQRDIVAANILE